MEHINILIATPGRNMEAEYVKSLVETITYLNSNNITYRFLNQYSPQVNAAREATVMDSRYLDAFNSKPCRGQVTYDKIFWIDSDISWNIEDFIKLYESDKDIISGIYLNEHGTPMFSVDEEKYKDKVSDLIKGTDSFDVFGVGFGFIAIKSGVFENIKRPWFENVFYKIKNNEGQEMLVSYGEDYSWCRKAHESGFAIYVDPTVTVSHHKKVKIGIQNEATL